MCMQYSTLCCMMHRSKLKLHGYDFPSTQYRDVQVYMHHYSYIEMQLVYY